MVCMPIYKNSPSVRGNGCFLATIVTASIDRENSYNNYGEKIRFITKTPCRDGSDKSQFRNRKPYREALKTSSVTSFQTFVGGV
jgi:hypothetical protein